MEATYPKITAIILTYNEEVHLQRCIDSVKEIVDDICVIDSYSTDNTKQIAEKNNVRFFSKDFISYSNKFNWALQNCSIQSDWIWRIDADEYATSKLAEQIREKLPSVNQNVNGIYINRRIVFLGKVLKHGGQKHSWQIKIFRNGFGYCENRILDEHIIVSGNTTRLTGDQIDENLGSINTWITKHNSYANKEVIEQLSVKHEINDSNDIIKSDLWGNSVERKRWFKKKYASSPLFLRPFILFIINYFFKLGFLDGKQGFIWNILQCFWYRFLVDTKIYEISRLNNNNKQAIIDFVKREARKLNKK